MSQRFEGKNLDDALTSASQTLGVERHQLTYHVLLEKRGFLGGVKRVVIEAEINEAAVVPPPSVAASVSVPSGAPPRRDRPSRGGRGGGDAGTIGATAAIVGAVAVRSTTTRWSCSRATSRSRWTSGSRSRDRRPRGRRR